MSSVSVKDSQKGRRAENQELEKGIEDHQFLRNQ